MEVFMKNYMYSGNLDDADAFFERDRFGEAKCQYEECLKLTKEYEPKNTQRIEYCERKIKECLVKLKNA